MKAKNRKNAPPPPPPAKEKKKIGRPRKAPTIGTSAGLHYSLEQIHGIWRATITLPNATVREFSLGTSNLAAAHDAAKVKAGQVARGLRWAEKQNGKPRTPRQARPRQAAPAPVPVPNAPAPPPKPVPLPPAPDPPPPPLPAAAAPPVPEKRAEDIAAKLRSIGDQQPIKPDGIFPGAPDNDDEQTADDQADELFADTIAMFGVMATLAIPKKILASRRPPLRPGKPDPWSLQAYTEGLQLGARKLMGAATLGPVGKTIAGAVGIMISMFVGAEPMNQQESRGPAPASSAPQPSPAPPPVPAPAPYSEDEQTALSTSNGFSSVGTFR